MQIKKLLPIVGTFAISMVSIPQASLALNLNLAPSAFTLTLPTALAKGDTNAQSTGLLNTTTDLTQGFDNFFTTSPYLALGQDSNNTIQTNDSFLGGQQPSATQTTRFQLNAAEVADGVDLKFDYIFAGIIGISSNFTVTLISYAVGVGGIPNGASNFTNITSLGSQKGATFALDNGINGVSPTFFNTTNFYELRIGLTVPNDFSGTDTAGGFQNITVTSAIPFDFEPTTGMAILGAGFGLNALRKRIKAKKETKV